MHLPRFSRFQSTHPHGVRPKREMIAGKAKCFNPRTHTGCDVPALFVISYEQSFNPRTHTGCDVAAGDASLYELRFNPRTHTGCDVYVLLSMPSCTPFQSTHPHGVRRLFLPLIFKGKSVSIHAPTRGATHFCVVQIRQIWVSIHAPTRGATHIARIAASCR